ncbi:Uncharacterised protein r2_g2946 [Pycnogonum litorale]
MSCKTARDEGLVLYVFSYPKRLLRESNPGQLVLMPSVLANRATGRTLDMTLFLSSKGALTRSVFPTCLVETGSERGSRRSPARQLDFFYGLEIVLFLSSKSVLTRAVLTACLVV